MKDEELRAQINELIKGEIQEGINDYIDSKEESEKTGLGFVQSEDEQLKVCLLYTSPSPRDGLLSRMPSSA